MIRVELETRPILEWSDMEADDFGADGPGVLFDASMLARKDDKCGTPDLFADA
jgi:hypothetical protein